MRVWRPLGPQELADAGPLARCLLPPWAVTLALLSFVLSAAYAEPPEAFHVVIITTHDAFYAPALTYAFNISIELVNRDFSGIHLAATFVDDENDEAVASIRGISHMYGKDVVTGDTVARARTLIGPVTATVGEMLFRQASLLGVPVLPIRAAATRLLDTTKFSTLVPTVQAPESHSMAIAQAIRALGWRRVAILVDSSASADNFDYAMSLELLLVADGVVPGDPAVEVVVHVTFDLDQEGSLNTALATLVQSRAKVFVLLSLSRAAASVLKAADQVGLVGPRYVWIGPRAWVDATRLGFELGSENIQLADGIIGVAPLVDTSLPEYQRLVDAWHAMVPALVLESMPDPVRGLSDAAWDCVHLLATALNKSSELRAGCPARRVANTSDEEPLCAIEEQYPDADGGFFLTYLMRHLPFTGTAGDFLHILLVHVGGTRRAKLLPLVRADQLGVQEILLAHQRCHRVALATERLLADAALPSQVFAAYLQPGLGVLLCLEGSVYLVELLSLRKHLILEQRQLLRAPSQYSRLLVEHAAHRIGLAHERLMLIAQAHVLSRGLFNY